MTDTEQPSQWAMELWINAYSALRFQSNEAAALTIQRAFTERTADLVADNAKLREENERLDQRETELMAELSGLDQFNIMLVNLVRRAMLLIPEGKSLWWDQANAALSMTSARQALAQQDKPDAK